METDRGDFDEQRRHWEKVFSNQPEKFGADPSWAAVTATRFFKDSGASRILEIGGGQGRDALFFARNGFNVVVTDYSAEGISAITQNAQKMGLSQSLNAICHDVRELLPFPDESFDACYSHMLYCMALTTSELECLSREIWRVLKPGGINVYSVRNTSDPDYGNGVYVEDDTYQVSGYTIHFFDTAMVERLSVGYEILSVEEFEEGNLPKRLYLVSLRKTSR